MSAMAWAHYSEAVEWEQHSVAVAGTACAGSEDNGVVPGSLADIACRLDHTLERSLAYPDTSASEASFQA